MHRREPSEDRGRDKRIHLLPRNTKDCLQPSEPGGGHESDYSSDPSEGASPAYILISYIYLLEW